MEDYSPLTQERLLNDPPTLRLHLELPLLAHRKPLNEVLQTAGVPLIKKQLLNNQNSLPT